LEAPLPDRVGGFFLLLGVGISFHRLQEPEAGPTA
jgi:hypothetical protein